MLHESVDFPELKKRLTATAVNRQSPLPEEAVAEAIERTHATAGPALRSHLDRAQAPAPECGAWTPERLIAWMAGTVINVVHEQRREGWRERTSLDDGPREFPDSAADSLTQLLDRELLGEVWARLDDLKPAYRQVLIMRLQEHPDAEIAAALGRPVNTISTWVRRGIRTLRTRLGERLTLPSLKPSSRSESGHE